jgi:multiple sugar transport system ATP-binding protein
MANVSLQNVGKTYTDARGHHVNVVRDINIEVADREFLVLVGPSGCGKSTTLRMIAGLEEISQGEIAIDGRRVNDVPPKDRDIAMVFQSYALYPHMSVYDNMAFGLKLRKYPKAEIKKRVQEAANILGLDAYLERRPKALSGGQRQRVALGRAIVRQPKVFLFDEPLSNLDAKMRVQTRMELIRLHQRLQATMIYVTHDQIEAMTMGTRIAVMQGGVLQQIAPPLELYHAPRNLFVAGFLGSPPMNFIHGTLAGDGDRLIFKEATGGVIQCAFREKAHPAFAPRVGQEVILGIRPEDVRMGQEPAGPDEAGFQAVVDIIEPMGAETNFYVQTGRHTLICRSPVTTDHRDTGHRLSFVLNLNRAHLFDPATTERII